MYNDINKKEITKELTMSYYTCDGWITNENDETVHTFEVGHYYYPATECEPPEAYYTEGDIESAIETVKEFEDAGHYKVWVEGRFWSEFDVEDDVEEE